MHAHLKDRLARLLYLIEFVIQYKDQNGHSQFVWSGGAHGYHDMPFFWIPTHMVGNGHIREQCVWEKELEHWLHA